jgi:hypothetical protein
MTDNSPVNDDLSDVLTSMATRRDEATHAKRANSFATREFLNAGVAILHDSLLANDGTDIRRRYAELFEPLRRSAVTRGASQRNPGHEGLGEGAYNNRWNYKDEYVKDLISYILRSAHKKNHYIALRRAISSGQLGDATLGELILNLAVTETRLAQADDIFALTYVIHSALPSDPVVRERAREFYETCIEEWAITYQVIAERYGLQLKPELSWRDLASILSTVTDGVIVRSSLDGDLALLDNKVPILVKLVELILPQILDGDPETGSFTSLKPTLR